MKTYELPRVIPLSLIANQVDSAPSRPPDAAIHANEAIMAASMASTGRLMSASAATSGLNIVMGGSNPAVARAPQRISDLNGAALAALSHMPRDRGPEPQAPQQPAAKGKKDKAEEDDEEDKPKTQTAAATDPKAKLNDQPVTSSSESRSGIQQSDNPPPPPQDSPPPISTEGQVNDGDGGGETHTLDLGTIEVKAGEGQAGNDLKDEGEAPVMDLGTIEVKAEPD